MELIQEHIKNCDKNIYTNKLTYESHCCESRDYTKMDKQPTQVKHSLFGDKMYKCNTY